MPELDALACPIYPCKIDHKRGLDRAPYPACWVDIALLVGATHNPIQDVHEAVCSECDEIEGIDDGRYGSLTKEKQLGNNANGFEDLGEGP